MLKFYLEISYLIGVIAFIIGLKLLSHPDTARRGNIYAAVGMLIAIIGTMAFHQSAEGARVGNYPWIFGGILVGGIAGYLMAMKIKMTAMPQLVSFFNGMGGASAAVIALSEYLIHPPDDTGYLVTLFLGLSIGCVAFSGSMIAYGKLEGKVGDIFNKIMPYINNLMLLVIIAIIVAGVYRPELMGGNVIWILLIISLVYGILFVMPIGGADMPVVISLLNSFTGLTSALTGLLYDNQVMLIGGILVGSAGTILTVLMCNAMNRSLLNVIVGSFGGGATAAGKGSGDKIAKEINLTDAAILCGYASRVIIVPGYGLAVAQAQHTCHEFEKQLTSRGVEVGYAIHPVAGRMPGHMNVLLAEADVSYDKLLELEDANSILPNTDVAIVVGANDVVNPAAEDEPSSPIYGMPIIKVNTAKNVIIMKRSMSPGYAGIANDLFFDERSRMLFGDAKDSITKLSNELKSL